MVENVSKTPDSATNADLLREGIISGRITTFTIIKESLPDYLEAAKAKECKGFEVQVIAVPGQCYPTRELPRRLKMGNKVKTPTITVVNSEPVKEGFVAISLQNPPDVIYETNFNRVRQQVEQRRLRREDRKGKEHEAKKDSEKIPDDTIGMDL